MRSFLLILVAIFMQNIAFAQVYQSHSFQNNILEVKCDWAEFKLIPYSDEIIKVHFYPNELDDSYDEFDIVISEPNADLQVELNDNTTSLTLDAGKAKVLINKSPFKISLYKNDELVLDAFDDQWRISYQSRLVRFKLEENERIYGLGRKAVDINRRNINTVLYNQNIVGYEWGENWLNTNIPMFLSSNLWAMYFDGHSMNYYSSDIIADNVFQYVVEDGHMSFFLIVGDSHHDLLQNYLGLSGNQKMIPRWSLGYMQSKFGYYSEADTEYRIYGMRHNGFPVDVVIFDYYWFGSAHNMGDHEWAGDGWIDPPNMIKRFKDHGIKSVLISEPYISIKSKSFQEFKENEYYTLNSKTGTYDTAFAVGATTVLLDIFNPDAANWLMGKYLAQMKYSGIEGWWLDLVEPEAHSFDNVHAGRSGKEMHNLYSLEYAKYMYNMMLENYPERRPFMMYRSGWAGAQNIGLTFQIGDERRSWMGLKSQIPIILAMSMSGAPWTGTDIGGFFNLDPNIDSELHLRWFQFGAFNPIMRMHIYGFEDSEPHLAPLDIRDEIKELMQLRYRLLPYNYNLIYENHVHGLPPVRQSDFYYHDNEKLQARNFQYYWGDKFFVAPVIDSAAVTKEVAFPPGKWIDYFDHTIYEGDQVLTVDAPLEKLPLYVHAGSMIPTSPEILSTDFYNGDSLIIEYYLDKDYPMSEYSMYDDDGITPDSYHKDLYEFINFTGEYKENEIVIGIERTGPGFNEAPKTRQLEFKLFYPDFETNSVFANGSLLPIVKEKEFYDIATNAYYHDKDSNLLYVKYQWNLEATEIKINDIVNSISENDELNIYPNPAKDHIYIENFDADIIEIIDIYGKVITTINTMNYSSNSRVMIELKDANNNELPKGVYFLKLSSGMTERYHKFTK